MNTQNQNRSQFNPKEIAKKLAKLNNIDKIREELIKLQLSIEEMDKVIEEIKKIDYDLYERLLGDVDEDPNDEYRFDDAEYGNVPWWYDECECVDGECEEKCDDE